MYFIQKVRRCLTNLNIDNWISYIDGNVWDIESHNASAPWFFCFEFSESIRWNKIIIVEGKEGSEKHFVWNVLQNIKAETCIFDNDTSG